MNLPAHPRVGIITQARTTSTRLPGKVLLDLGGRTVLDHHLDRLEGSGLPVLVATTLNATDDPVAALAETRGLRCFRGSENDVLSRFHGCATESALDVVVRVTSDCPLIDARLIADAVDEYLVEDDSRLYLSNTLERTFPRGFDFEVFSGASLAEAQRRVTDPMDREHVTPYFYRGIAPDIRIRQLRRDADRSVYRVTLDTPEDLTLIRTLVEVYDAARLSCDRIIDILDSHEELVALNAEIEQKKLGT